jgi:hypothetical protein
MPGGSVGIGITNPSAKLDVKSTQTSGTLGLFGAPSAVTLAGALTGINLNLSTNFTATGQSVTGQSISLPAVTNTGTGTYNYKGLTITGGALVQNTGAGTNNWTGVEINMPNITQTTGTVTSTGLRIIGGTVNSGTSYGLIVDANAGNVGIGTTNPGYALDVSGYIRSSQEIISTLGSASSQFRAIAGNYGLMLRNDGSATNFLLTNSGNQYGTWNSLRPLIISNANGNVGIGNNTLYIQHGGNVGIGTTGPMSKLIVRGTQGNLAVNTESATNAIAIEAFDDGNTTKYPILLNPWGGNIGIGLTNPSYQLQLSQNSAAKPTSNTWTIASDARIKNVVRNYEKGLAEILQINPIIYTYKENNALGIVDPGEHVGIIAQAVQPIFPEAVTTNDRGYLHFTSDAINWASINAIKELNTKINSLSSQFSDLSLTSTGDLNIQKDQTGNYTVKKTTLVGGQSLTETITRLAAFAQTVIGEVKAGLVSAKEIITDKLTLTTDNLTIAGKTLAQYIDERINQLLTTNYTLRTNNNIVSPVIETEEIQLKTQNAKLKTTTENAKLEITDNDNTPVAQFNTDEKKTTLFGSLEVKNDQNKGKLAEVIIKGLNDAVVARIDNQGNASLSGTLTAKEVQSEKLKVESLEGQEATISGKLTAKEVEAENINQLNQQLASQSADINQIQQLLAQIKDAPLPDTSNMTNLSNTTNLENLTVTGDTNLYNLNVSNSLVAGNLLIENDKILSLSWDLKLSALSQINFFDQAVTIAKDGTITTKGALIAQGGIKVNTIQAANDGEDINIKLKTQNSKFKTTAENAKLNIIDELGNVQASIDASGSAFFKALSLEKFTPATPAATIVSPQDNFEKRGVFAAAIETASASAGIGILPQNQQEVIIYNDNVKEDSLIYITPQNAVAQKLTVGEKAAGYFKVITDTVNHPDVKFDWLIIN